MRKTLTLKKLFTLLVVCGAFLAVLFAVAIHQLSRAKSQLVEANENRYRSYLLADELRQSSDELTRLARTYVVTGDAKYEQQYNDILDIRNGKKPRPQNYERIYWDFVAAGDSKPRPDGETIALTDLMTQAGFTNEELAKLKEAQNNSDALVRTEIIAMNAVKGLFDDGTGKFTRKDAPDMEMARQLVHSADYHKYKASIMKPVDEFFVLLDNRTGAAVAAATQASNQAFTATVATLLFSMLAAFLALQFVYRRIRRQLGAEPTETQEIANKIAAGDLAVPIRLKDDDKTSLMYAMSAMRDSLASIVSQVRVGTDTIASASTQIAAGNHDLSSRTQQQAGALEETASSMEELTSTVKQNADNARQANMLAASASAVAEKGGAVVSQVVDTMAAINESARKIVDIIGVIDGIAFQTNILALNAAVEAARAGEQGRGFAVVASEVRNLAQRSASAAKEIKLLIDDSVDKVGTGAQLVDQAGTTMQEVVESVKRVTDIMTEIAAASQEQTAGIEQVNNAITQMDDVTQQNASLVEEAAAASESLQDQANKLAQLVSVFKLDTAQSIAGTHTADVVPFDKHAKRTLTPVQSPAAAPERSPIQPAYSRRKLAVATAATDGWEQY